VWILKDWIRGQIPRGTCSGRPVAPTRTGAHAISGSPLGASIDGEELLVGIDDEYAHGEMGLRARDGSEVWLWDFAVTLLERPHRDRDDRDR
jgi:hypothetical protein